MKFFMNGKRLIRCNGVSQLMDESELLERYFNLRGTFSF